MIPSVYTDRFWDGIMSVGINYRRNIFVGNSVAFLRFSGSVNCLSSKKKDEGLDHISRWSNNLNMLLCFLNGKVKVWFWDLLACRDDLTRDRFVKTLCPRIGNRKFIDAMKEFDKLHERTMWRSIMSSLSEELRAAVLEHICFYA
jgi:hypothetical protein